MDQPDRYRHDQDILFRDLEAKMKANEQAALKDMIARAEEAGMNRTSILLNLAMRKTSIDETEQEIVKRGGRARKD